ncbi:MAG: hopanoid biosynthesis-associated protein HpnK [Chthonomonadales bacterium]
MRWIIINADDFGSTDRVNAAIIRAHREGILTSTSLMVNEPAAAAAVQLAKETPGLAVGLHLALSNGFAASSPSNAPHLVLRNGRYRDDPARAGFAYFFKRTCRQEVRSEILSQFARFAATGLPWSHVDGHQHLHMHPVIWDEVIHCSEKFGAKCIRIPYEPWQPATKNNRFGRRVEWVFFRALRSRCLKTLAGKGFTVADRVYGHLETGRMTAAYVNELLGRLEGESNEIYFHPGTPHAAKLGLNDDMDVELDALLNKDVRATVDRLDLQLTTYPKLAASKQGNR